MNIKIKKLHPDAVIPTYATNGSACFDLYAIKTVWGGEENYYKVRTGLSFEIPQGHVMKIYIRSGHAFGKHLALTNGVGIIDSDFRGEVIVGIHDRDGDCGVIAHAGERIAQAMIVPVKQVEFSLVEELSKTDRGEGGFGSTGV